MVSAQKAQWITDSAVVLEGWFSEIIFFLLYLPNLLFPKLEEWSPVTQRYFHLEDLKLSLVSQLEWKVITPGAN